MCFFGGWRGKGRKEWWKRKKMSEEGGEEVDRDDRAGTRVTCRVVL